MQSTTKENWLLSLRGKNRYEIMYDERTALLLDDGQILGADVYDDYLSFYLTSKDLQREKQLLMITIESFNAITPATMILKLDAAIAQAGTV